MKGHSAMMEKMYFANNRHEDRFLGYIGKNPGPHPVCKITAVYMLTGEKDLWERAENAVTSRAIHFDQIDVAGISDYGYALLCLARDFFYGTTHATLKDFSNNYIIADRILYLTLTAIKIGRNGFTLTGSGPEME